MRSAVALAAALAALLAAPAPAAAPPAPARTAQPAGTTKAEPTLADDNILWQDMPTYDQSLGIDLVSTKHELAIAAAAVKVSRLVNSEELSLRDDSVILAPKCDGKDDPFPIDFGPGKACSIGVTLNQREEPGVYSARVSLFGKQGEREEVRLKFAVRRPLEWALGLVFAGLLIGFFVTSWRGSGRERTRKVIAIKQATEALALLDSSVGTAPRMAQLLAWGSEQVDALIDGRAVEDSEIALLQARVSQYRFILEIERSAAELPDTARRELAAVIMPVVDSMQPTAANRLAEIPQERFDEVRKKLRELQASSVAAKGIAESAISLELLPLPVTSRMSARTARLAYQAAEWGVAILLMLVFALSAIGSLYYGQTAWGSHGDLITAFLVGFGAYAGAVTSVDNFVQRAQVKP